MKVAIVGSRDWPVALNHLIREYVKSLPADAVVVSGGARGVDSVAESAAKACGLRTEVFLPDWDLYGRSAGYRRNQTIVQNADSVVAFQHRASRGTQHSIDIARAQGKVVVVVESGVK